MVDQSRNHVSILVTSEDNGKNSTKTMHALAREIIKQLFPKAKTNYVKLTPLEDQDAILSVRANNWKNRQSHQTIALIRSLITQLLKPNGFIFFHVDGDCRWSNRASCENIRLFNELILPRIKNGLTHEFNKRKITTTDADRHAKRVCLLVPFYSIEAWLYQNTVEAKRICQEDGCGQCGPLLDQWAHNRSLLDDVLRPKDTTLCLRDQHNARLATTGFPATETCQALTSFAHTCLALTECEELMLMLSQTSA